MTKAKKTPSFIHELRLCVSPFESKILTQRLDVARQIYNACLGEGLKRLKLMKESKVYRQALRTSKKKQKLRNSLFKKARTTAKFSEYALHGYLTRFYSKTWLTRHIDSLTAQKLASRAFDAVDKYAYKKRGRPRFKGKGQFRSMEGKNNACGIRFIDGNIIFSVKGGIQLRLTPIYDKKDKDNLAAYALSCRTKYVRLVCKSIKGFSVWYAQRVQEGYPYVKKKHPRKSGIVGLDIGPSTIAMVSAEKAVLQSFCPEVEDYRSQISFLQKKMSRSIRAMNPDNYEPDTVKKKKMANQSKNWVRSKKVLNPGIIPIVIKRCK